MKDNCNNSKEQSYSRKLPNDGIETIEIEPIALEDM